MNIFLWRDNKTAKLWVTGVGNDIMVDTLKKNAADFPAHEVSKIAAKIMTFIKRHHKLHTYSIYSEPTPTARATLSRKKTATPKKKTAKKSPKTTTLKSKPLGKLVSVVYKSSVDGVTLVHDFKHQPTLSAPSGHSLAISGGKFKITDRGIIG
jgi:hypothetical protein